MNTFSKFHFKIVIQSNTSYIIHDNNVPFIRDGIPENHLNVATKGIHDLFTLQQRIGDKNWVLTACVWIVDNYKCMASESWTWQGLCQDIHTTPI